MKTKTKMLAIAIFITMIAVMPLSAQNVRGTLFGGPTSNQTRANASAAFFAGEVDYFVMPNFFDAAGVKKWSMFIHGENSGVSNSLTTSAGTFLNNYAANIGYAVKLGENDTYLGIRYIGNILSSREESGETVTAQYDFDNQSISQITETQTFDAQWTNSTNQIEALLGFNLGETNKMGVKVGFFESMALSGMPASITSTSTIDYQDGRIQYQNEIDDYKRYRGHIIPFLGWGMMAKTDKITVRPFFTVELDFYQQKRMEKIAANYTIFHDEVIGRKTINNNNGDNSGYIQPTFKTGFWMELPRSKTEKTRNGIGFDYNIGFNAYNNSYDNSGFSGKTKGTVTWAGNSWEENSIAVSETQKTTTLTMNDQSYLNQWIRFRYGFSTKVADNLNMGVTVALPFTITTTSQDRYRQNLTQRTVIDNITGTRTVTDTRIHFADGIEDQIRLIFNPTIHYAIRYDWFPGRFRINAGVIAAPLNYNYTKTTTSPNGPGQVTTSETKVDGVTTNKTTTVNNAAPASDSVNKVSTWNAFLAGVTGGFVFNFNENFAVDMMIGLTSTANLTTGNFNLELTDLNIMFTLKFDKKGETNEK